MCLILIKASSSFKKFIMLLALQLGNLCLFKVAKIFFPYFSSRVLYFVFPNQACDYNFLIWCEVWIKILFLHMDIQLLKRHLLKASSFLYCQFWHLHQKSIDYKSVRSVSRLCYVPLVYLSILMSMPYCFISIAQAFSGLVLLSFGTR